jgi:hypothetical protein
MLPYADITFDIVFYGLLVGSHYSTAQWPVVGVRASIHKTLARSRY